MIRVLRWVPLATVVLLAAGTAQAAPLGYLQVKAGQGISVELEGVGTHVSDGGDGVLFRGLEAGRYWVTARREGYEPQRASVDVVLGNVVVHHLQAWQPIPVGVVKPKASKGVGALIVQTFPVEATVDAKRLGWRKIEKGDGPFIASNIPAGTHRITFCNTYKCIDYRAKIEPNRLKSIIVDFDPGEIEDVSDLHRQQLAEWRRMCAEGEDHLCKQACDLDVALSPGRRSAACENVAPRSEALAKKAPEDDAFVQVSRTPPCLFDETIITSVTLETSDRYELFLGARRLGRGPSIAAELPSGCVELRAVNAKLGIDRRVRVDIDPDTAKSYRVEP